MTLRRLIVNADDFGLSAGVNRGIAEAFERGIVTSASLMVRAGAATAAADYAVRHPRLAVGLHADLGEWVHRGGRWLPTYEVVPLADPRAVGRELERQLALFEALVGRPPTHLDSHQHVHLVGDARGVFEGAARDLSVPLRGTSDDIRYCGDFYGQTGEGRPIPGAVSVGRLQEILVGLPEGTTELACHPGRDFHLDCVYRMERAREVDTLTDPRIRKCLDAERIGLISFGELGVEGARVAECESGPAVPSVQPAAAPC